MCKKKIPNPLTYGPADVQMVFFGTCMKEFSLRCLNEWDGGSRDKIPIVCLFFYIIRIWIIIY